MIEFAGGGTGVDATAAAGSAGPRVGFGEDLAVSLAAGRGRVIEMRSATFPG